MIEAQIRNLFADIASAPVDAWPTPDLLRQVRRRQLRNRSGIALLSLTLVCGAAAGVNLTSRLLGDRATTPMPNEGTQVPVLTSVAQEQVAQVCCKLGLRAPSTSRPTVSKVEAEQIALKYFPPGTSILESVLASTPQIPNGWLAAGVPVGDFWIVSPKPPGDARYTFALVFIDARTGTLLSRAYG